MSIDKIHGVCTGVRFACFMMLVSAGYGQAHAQGFDVAASTASRGTLASIEAYAQTQSGGLPTSAKRVRIHARFMSKEDANGSREIAVRLLIAPGWHVNANPATFDFLIPTRVRALVAGKPARIAVRYPPGRASNVRLESKTLQVYDDGTVIGVRVPAITLTRARKQGGLELAVTVQSCSDKGICLPPARLTTLLPL